MYMLDINTFLSIILPLPKTELVIHIVFTVSNRKLIYGGITVYPILDLVLFGRVIHYSTY